MREKTKIVILSGPFIWHKNTCAEIIAGNLNVVGICICNKTSFGLPIKFVINSFKTKGVLQTLSQILSRTFYKIKNSRKDKIFFNKYFPIDSINNVLSKWNGEIHYTDSYSNPQTLKWLKKMDADIFVAHTGYIVGKKVREIPKLKMVIGGHPGITPFYRGNHSSFWAIYNNDFERIGYTVFILDSGIDTGDIIFQDRIKLDGNDSFITLGWKGMKLQAVKIRSILVEYDKGKPIARKKITQIPDNSYYDNPALLEYLKYLKKQRIVR